MPAATVLETAFPMHIQPKGAMACTALLAHARHYGVTQRYPAAYVY